MKVGIVLLLSLGMMVGTALGRPAEPDVTSEVDNVHSLVPQEPEVMEEVQIKQAEGDDQELKERVRRSPQWKQQHLQQPGPRPLPSPQQNQNRNRGSISGGIHREKGVGTIVQAQGERNIWTSKNGNGRLDAHGQWSKVVNGPARGKPNYNVGISYSHRF